MFGLHIEEQHDGYVGYRAIYTNRYIDIVPNRGSSHGSEESIKRVIKWANTERKLDPPPGKKRPRKISPWKQMREDVPNILSTTDRENWEISEGNFTLRCNPNASHGYLYIALFERKPKFVTDPTEIDDVTDAWHDNKLPQHATLHEALGWTWEQYARWVETQEIPTPPTTENELSTIDQ